MYRDMIDPDHIGIIDRNSITSPNVLRVDVGDEDVSGDGQFRSAEGHKFLLTE